jgi:hypothetical protein
MAAPDRSKPRGHRSTTVGDESIAVGSRFMAVVSRFLVSGDASFSPELLVFPDRAGSTEKEEATIMSTNNKSIHRATITLAIPDKVTDARSSSSTGTTSCRR